VIIELKSTCNKEKKKLKYICLKKKNTSQLCKVTKIILYKDIYSKGIYYIQAV